MAAETMIAAKADRVLKVLLDFDSYPSWSGLSDVKVLAENKSIGEYLISCKLNSGGFSDELEIKILQRDATTIVWELVESNLLAQLTGEFQVAPLDEILCRVIYELDIRFKNPLMNMMKKSIEGQMIAKLLERLAKRAIEA